MTNDCSAAGAVGLANSTHPTVNYCGALNLAGPGRKEPTTMYLVQVLLPLYDNDKYPFTQIEFDRVRNELTEAFGGITAYFRSPAMGAWKTSSEKVSHDEIVVFEVMCADLDRGWWSNYRRELESRFRQIEIVVRATKVERL
jgi:hypothetical protein